MIKRIACFIASVVLAFSLFGKVELYAGKDTNVITNEHSQDKNDELVFENIRIKGFKREGLVYTGKKVCQNLSVFDGDKKLNRGIDYKLTYKNAVNAASYADDDAPTVKITFMGNYKGTLSLVYSIEPKNIEATIIYDLDSHLVYTGAAQKYVPKIYDGDVELSINDDFEISYEGNNLEGIEDSCSEIDYCIRGKKNYCGEIYRTYSIDDSLTNLSTSELEISNETVYFSGESIMADDLGISLRVMKNGEYVPVDYHTDKDVAIKVRYNSIPGTGVVWVIPKSKAYTGYLKREFNIVGAYDIKADTSFVGERWQEEVEYDKAAALSEGIEQNISGLLTGKDGKELIEGQDYTIKYYDNTDVGEAKLLIKGINKYTGEIKKTFNIVAKTDFKVVVPDAVKYTKEEVKPAIEVYDSKGLLLEKDTDYSVSLENNTEIGEASYKVEGLGKYEESESKTGTFEIVKGSLSDCKIIVPDCYYSKEKGFYKKEPIVLDSNGKVLTAGVDYEKKFKYLINGDKKTKYPKPGTEISIKVVGKGCYEGSSAVGKYTVCEEKNKIEDLFIAIGKQYYTGEAIELDLNDSIHVYKSAEDRKQKINELKAADYLKIVSYSNNINVGKAVVIVQGNGVYGGLKKLGFTISPKIIKGIIDNNKIHEENSSEIESEISDIQSTNKVISGIKGKKQKIQLKSLLEAETGNSLKYKSSDSFIASVDSEGVVYFKNIGTCFVRIYDDDSDIETYCKIVVNSNIENDRLNVVDYGAVTGDGQNDLPAIQSVCENAKEGDVIYFPEGIYDINILQSGIVLENKKNVHFVFDEGAILKLTPNSAKGYEIIRFINCKYCDITGGTIIGDRNAHKGTEGEWGMGIDINKNNEYIVIDSVTIKDCWGDGIYVGGDDEGDVDKHITIRNCIVFNNRRNNISITGGDYVTIDNCQLMTANGTDPQFGIDIETNYNNNSCEHIFLNETVISDNAKGAFGIITPANDIILKDCKLKGNLFNLKGICMKCIDTEVDGLVKDYNDIEWIRSTNNGDIE